MAEQDYEKISAEEAIKLLNANPERGLSSQEALERVKRYGYNEIIEKKGKFLKKAWKEILWPHTFYA